MANRRLKVEIVDRNNSWGKAMAHASRNFRGAADWPRPLRRTLEPPRVYWYIFSSAAIGYLAGAGYTWHNGALALSVGAGLCLGAFAYDATKAGYTRARRSRASRRQASALTKP